MTTPTISTLRCSCAASADANVDGFLECLKQDSSISSLVYTPTNPSYQSVLDFSIRNKRSRSGGHDFEGLSYVSEVPFVIIDLLKLSEVTVDAPHKTAWVGAGATLGMLYYNIAIESPRLGFPGGFCQLLVLAGTSVGEVGAYCSENTA
ncbi:UNVERIFIED_CONTAM: Berberine bridge enzyme-like 18 [Sesamum radiatum]|uniref:Berberine bridge enzyme-like 18 n=1 Tax=Sesamum radiatum TaxID=300843 RepID=A0AAW2UP78_SESRA